MSEAESTQNRLDSVYDCLYDAQELLRQADEDAWAADTALNNNLNMSVKAALGAVHEAMDKTDRMRKKLQEKR